MTVSVASGDAPIATASRACNISGQEQSFNTSYVTSLKVFGTTCLVGKRVIRAYHACRINNGGANGRCPNRVRTYGCREGQRQGVPGVQYNARVVCTKSGGARKIVSTYTQNV